MKLIDEYNRTETLKMLEKIIYANTETKEYKTEISFGDIYDTLSECKDSYPACNLDNFWTYFPQCVSQYMYENEKFMEAQKDYISWITYSIKVGDYFHYIFKSEESTERMIININTQENAMELSRALLSLLMQMSSENCPVVSFKFFLKSDPSSQVKVKKDKIVVYYEHKNRNIVYDKIIAAAGLCRAKPTDFSKNISPFYHLAGDDNGNFPIGIAVEITSTGMSFTGNCSNEILFKLTEKRISNTDPKDKMEQKFEITNNSLTAEQLFEHVKTKCCKPY